MKKLTVAITDKNGEEKDISVCVENETADALEQCSEEIRRMYILDEYEDQKLTHKETRRHISYEQITELGLDIASDEESQEDRLIRLEVNSRLHTAMKRLTDKQYLVLWRYAVDGHTFQMIADEMGISKDRTFYPHSSPIWYLRTIWVLWSAPRRAIRRYSR